MSKYGIDPENQIIGLAILSDLSIDPGTELQRLGISDGLRGRNDRANGRELVERFRRSVLTSRSGSYLPVA